MTTCSKTCGGGTQLHTRTIVKHEENDGAFCTGENLQEIECNTDNCPAGNIISVLNLLPSSLYNFYVSSFGKNICISYILVICTCSTPGTGVGYQNNRMACSNGQTVYCSLTEECYSTEPFDIERLYDGCRIPGYLFLLLSASF